jgi:hypothetical protein
MVGNEMTAVRYEERYCAYVDILGFQELIGALHGDPTKSEALKTLLTRVHTPVDLKIDAFQRSDFRAQSISDAVALSAAINRFGLGHMLYALERLAIDLLEQGYFVRGAIVKGPLYHDEQMVFGEALVQAYHLENEVARYPRIMIRSDVVATMPHSFQRNFFRQAEDGPTYQHVLRLLENAIYAEKKSPASDRYINIQTQIQQRLTEAVDNPKHFEKVQWFCRYWNSIVAEKSHHGVRRIEGPGLDQAPALWG